MSLDATSPAAPGLHRTRLPTRAVLAVGGPDARAFLQGLLTNSVTAVTPDRPVWAGLLSPQGKCLFDLMVFDDGAGGLLVDADAGRLADLTRRLTMYRLRAAVTLTPRPDLAVFAAWGDGTPPAGAQPDPRLPALGWRWIAAANDTASTATPEAYRRHRWCLGVPEGAAEVGVDALLWLETNAEELNGVDFRKGCYVGQENTARMHFRNKVRKRLLPLDLPGAASGDELGDDTVIRSGDGKPAGDLVARDGDLGLALMRMEYVEDGAALTLGGQPVTVRPPDYLAAG